MQRLIDPSPPPARRRARRHRGDVRRCCSCRCSASPPSPSTSARSTPSGPACRSPPTPRRSPSPRTAPAATAATCSPPPRRLITANDGEGTAAQPVLSSDPLSVTVTGSTPMEHWFAPVIGHDSTGGLRHGDRRLGRAQPGHGRAAADLLLVLVQGADRRRPALEHDRADDLPHQVRRRRPAAPARRATSSRVASASWTPTRAPARPPARIDEQLPSSTGRVAARGCDAGRLRRSGSGRRSCCRSSTSSAATGSNAWYRVYGYAAFQSPATTSAASTAPARSRAVRQQRQRPLRHRLLHPLRRALRRLELQPRRPAARAPPSSD